MDQNLLDMMRTNWVWVPSWSAEDDSDVRIVYFRKEFEVAEVPASNVIRISADARYKLYVNGTFVQEGPQKALDLKEWFVDTADIAPYLVKGTNCIAAEVIRFPEMNFSMAQPKTNDSLLRTPLANLYVEDTNGSPDPRVPRDPSLVTVAAKTGWKCSINREIRIYGEDAHPAPIHVQEDVHPTAFYRGWKNASYDDSAWEDAQSYTFFDMPGSDAPGNLVPRTIPAQRHIAKKFEKVVCLRDPASVETYVDEAMKAQAMGAGYPEAAATAAATKQKPLLAVLDDEAAIAGWEAMLAGGKAVTIPAHTTQIVEISAGAEECGYLHYAMEGGAGAKIDTLCAEAYAKPGVMKGEGLMASVSAPVKGDRTDYEHSGLFGHTSTYTAAGYGTAESAEIYEPYWFRTFRFIRLTVTTADEPLTIRRFDYLETGYPLDVKTRVKASDPIYAPIWDISVRTLERCMHETYFDCPFYEQLQYAMDGRSEILYTYATSADDRLARQAIEAFRRSQRPDGMTNSDAPTAKSNVIPGFSIYYLMMVYDHMMYFGDQSLVKENLPAIDRILNFFDTSRMDNGLVGHIGGPIMRDRYWSFIDWSVKWSANGGVPTAISQNTRSLTMESLLYTYGLQHAAEMAAFAGRAGLAEEYRNRADEMTEAIRENCFGTYTDKNGKSHRLIQDGCGVDEFSVHAQVFAVLTGVVTPEEGREMLHATVGNEDLAQSSVSFMFYLFRALEKCGLYEETDERWNLWRQMVKDHLTTCVENDTDARSDCHAWASLMCYELPAVVLGVRPAAPGFAKVHIAPQMGALDSASGDVITPRGMVHVSWTRGDDGRCEVEYELPDGMENV